MIDKSLLTNLLAAAIVVTGLLWTGPWQALILNTGLFALSGGITNWLAIHMLFEKIPGFYGSGVIPARFEEFKAGIKSLIMGQFFNEENINRFFRKIEEDAEQGKQFSGLDRLVDAVDLNGAFESLIEVIMNSSFASMLSMVGGRKALEPLRMPFIEKMRHFLSQLGKDGKVLEQVRQASTQTLLDKVELIVEQRLNELTPELVKTIIQNMIRQHLGWLVVWGGVLGGLIGLVSSLLLRAV